MARIDWGFGQTENLTPEDLVEERYRGIRPAAGYPASPDHTEKETLWKLLDVDRRAGIKLTENFAMWPGSRISGSVSGMAGTLAAQGSIGAST